MKWFKERLTEKSTWRGLALFAGVLGFNIDPMLINEIGVGVAAAVAVSETLISEKVPA